MTTDHITDHPGLVELAWETALPYWLRQGPLQRILGFFRCEFHQKDVLLVGFPGNSSELVPPSNVPLGVAALVCRNAPVTGRTGKDLDDVACEQESYRERGPAIPSSE